jgi:hypothetical protein
MRIERMGVVRYIWNDKERGKIGKLKAMQRERETHAVEKEGNRRVSHCAGRGRGIEVRWGERVKEKIVRLTQRGEPQMGGASRGCAPPTKPAIGRCGRESTSGLFPSSLTAQVCIKSSCCAAPHPDSSSSCRRACSSSGIRRPRCPHGSFLLCKD